MKFRMDALHYALLAALVLLVLYAARSHGMFKEGVPRSIQICEKIPGPTGIPAGVNECYNEVLEHTYPHDNGHTKSTKIASK